MPSKKNSLSGILQSGIVTVTRRATFSAAHRLHNDKKSAAWNSKTFSICNSPHYHGHNYILEVEVSGRPDPDTGYVIDLGHLRQIVDEKIVSKCDHKNLNLDVSFLRGIIPSSENLAIAFWNELAPYIIHGKLSCIRVIETDNNQAEYRG